MLMNSDYYCVVLVPTNQGETAFKFISFWRELQKLIPVLSAQVSLENPASVLGSYSFTFCCLSSPRNFIRALCSCDFEVPTEQPSMRAISSCSCPSMS